MKNFNIDEFNFGEVEYNSTHCIGIQYLGDEKISTKNFSVGCGCTNVTYNENTKILNVCLNMNIPTGVKTATITANLANNVQEIIILRGTLKQ